MRLGVLSTSWPSAARPWAGHFVADLARALAPGLDEVIAVVPSWGADGPLLGREGVRVVPAVVPGPARSPGGHPLTGLSALAALRARAGSVPADLWLCHWWPTTLAAPRGTPRLAVLHGSDVDLLERLPRALRMRLAPEDPIAVAEGLAARFAAATGAAPPAVCVIGARPVGPDDRLPAQIRWWAESRLPKVLTVARDAPGKGLGIAREAARRLGDVAWLVVTPELGAGPAEIRALLARAELLVVPSLDGSSQPSEGRPHVIAQALVAGVPVLGGPNRAVRQALAAAGQQQLRVAGADSLVAAVRRALSPLRWEASAAAARREGRALQWSALAEPWHEHLRQAAGSKPSAPVATPVRSYGPEPGRRSRRSAG